MAKSDIRDYNATLTPEQRRESAQRAAAASAVARQGYKRQRDLIKQVLAAQVDDPTLKEKLKELGFDTTFGSAMVFAQAKKALVGDTEAARYLRDTVGEKPTEAYQLAVTDKPIRAMDLSALSDEELEALADEADG